MWAGEIEMHENSCSLSVLQVQIVVAAHKRYTMPGDEIYLPLHVGAEGKIGADGKPLDLGYKKDNTGENISELNGSFCELTGLYWAWKNLDADYIGLTHYRRLFEMDGRPLTYKQIKPYLGKIKLFTPRKRRYVIETLKSHYSHTHYMAHLETAKAVLVEKYPEYKGAYEKAICRTWGYMFNMMIMEQALLDEYCQWLFDILFETFKRIDCSRYSDFEKRYMGRISEILFNAWLEQQLRTGRLKKEETMELKCSMEENWGVKIPAFFKAKFFGKKYERSF